MGKVCQISDGGLQGMLDRLGKERREQVLMKALTEGAKSLQGKTVANLRAEVPGSEKTSDRPGRRNPMTSGVRVIKDKDFLTAVVSIMKDFRLKWFEKGTEGRFTSSGAWRGRIKGKGFFSQARQDSGNVISVINDNIKKELDKILR